MHVLVLHSDVPPGAPPDEVDTLLTAQVVSEVLGRLGHRASRAAFANSPESLRAAIEERAAEIVFNLVESVSGQDELAAIVPAILDRLGVAYTGCGAAQIAMAADKTAAKTLLRNAGLPTPDWAEPPLDRVDEDRRFIVKSCTQDASLGLDDGAVVRGRTAIAARIDECRSRFGGRWFAEAYVEGREFNVAILEDDRGLHVLPIAEMRFEDWPQSVPQIVGYRAKWEPDSHEARNTVRRFGLEAREPALADALSRLAMSASRLFQMKAYARVDFRVDAQGRAQILEINPNPCLHPEAGFAAACAEAGIAFDAAIARILAAAATPRALVP